MPRTLIAAIFLAGTIAIFTDWLLMGVLFHRHYNRHPEIWRQGLREQGDRKAIIFSSILAYLTAAGVIVLCAQARAIGIAQCVELAVLAWLAGPLVVVVINGIWIKIDPRVTFSHALGYLARFVLAGAAAGLVLR